VLRLHYSNRFEVLVRMLADRVAAVRAGSLEALFAPIDIVVPNQQVAAYVRFEVARRSGVATNLRFPFLEAFVAGLAPEGVRVLQREHLQTLLIDRFADPELLADDELAPVRRYLAAGGDEPAATELRRVQLAAHLAGLFTEYAVARPELLERWAGAAPGLDFADAEPAVAETERWQRRLYRAVLARAGGEVTWTTTTSLIRAVDPERLRLPQRFHLIGFSFLARGYGAILGQLARRCEVEVYALNPCREFWEDTADARRRRRPGTPADPDRAPAALELWGTPGRDTIALLNDLSGYQAVDDYLRPEGEHALARLQADLLERRRDCRGAPGGVHVLSCPSVRRELEIIGNEIWSRMLADPGLRFNDIAILITRERREVYQAQAPAVFGELHGIPHHLVGLPLVSESRLVEAFELLLELPLGRFSRPEMLRVLTHPAVLARFPGVDPADWVTWADRLGIVHGADADDHAGTYLEGSGSFHWDQGLRRLALGALMTGERSGDSRIVRIIGASDYRPEELPRDHQGSGAAFALMARSLIEDSRNAREAQLTLGEWRRYFDALAAAYLVPASDADTRHLGRLREAIAGLADPDLTLGEVGYRVAAALLRERLGGLVGGRGEALADGVTIAPLAPMRPLPYRVIFVAGLDEATFPTQERDSPLDLRRARAAPGDIGPRDRDRYAFLEVVLSARDALYLSYIGDDELTGETLSPSPVVVELEDMLGRTETDRIVHPHRRWDPRYAPDLYAAAGAPVAGPPLPSHSPAAERQARARALRLHLERTAAERGQRPPDPDALRALVAAGTGPAAALEPIVRLPRIEAAPASTPTEQVSLPLSLLRRFLECPLQAWARAVIGLREDDDDLAVRRDEPFQAGPLRRTLLLREVLFEMLREGVAGDRLAEVYARRVRPLALSSQLPAGVFHEVEGERDRRLLGRWLATLDDLGPGGDWRTLSFGRAHEHDTVDELLPSLRLEIELPSPAGPRPVELELHGRGEIAGGPAVGALVVSTRATPGLKYALRGFLDHAVLAAAGVEAGADRRSTVLGAVNDERYRLAPWTEAEARAYLGGLAVELLAGVHDYFLPCEAVERAWLKGKPLAEAIDEQRGPGARPSSQHGPVRRYLELAAPADADAIVRRRFGPLFDRAERIGA
jgi:exodeoxyribonuclease V gamma subunit